VRNKEIITVRERLLLQICLLLLSLAAQSGSAGGVLKLNETEVPMTASGAFMKDGRGEFAGEKMPLEILVADRAFPPSLLETTFGASALARSGMLTAVGIRLHPSRPRELVVTLYTKPRRPGMGPMSLTLTNSEAHRLEEFSFSEGRVKGKLVSPQPDTRPGFGADENDKPDTFQFSLQFDTPVRKPAPITAVLKGKAAQTSAPVAVVLKLRDAMRRGDLEGAKGLAAPSMQLQVDEMIQQMGLAEVKKQMQAMARSEPSNAVWLKSLSQVVLRGDKATVIVRMPGGSEVSTLRKIGSVWKMADP
jgi:hypothetical protein